MVDDTYTLVLEKNEILNEPIEKILGFFGSSCKIISSDSNITIKINQSIFFDLCKILSSYNTIKFNISLSTNINEKYILNLISNYFGLLFSYIDLKYKNNFYTFNHINDDKIERNILILNEKSSNNYIELKINENIITIINIPIILISKIPPSFFMINTNITFDDEEDICICQINEYSYYLIGNISPLIMKQMYYIKHNCVLFRNKFFKNMFNFLDDNNYKFIEYLAYENYKLAHKSCKCYDIQNSEAFDIMTCYLDIQGALIHNEKCITIENNYNDYYNISFNIDNLLKILDFDIINIEMMCILWKTFYEYYKFDRIFLEPYIILIDYNNENATIPFFDLNDINKFNDLFMSYVVKYGIMKKNENNQNYIILDYGDSIVFTELLKLHEIEYMSCCYAFNDETKINCSLFKASNIFNTSMFPFIGYTLKEKFIKKVVIIFNGHIEQYKLFKSLSTKINDYIEFYKNVNIEKLNCIDIYDMVHATDPRDTSYFENSKDHYKYLTTSTLFTYATKSEKSISIKYYFASYEEMQYIENRRIPYTSDKRIIPSNEYIKYLFIDLYQCGYPISSFVPTVSNNKKITIKLQNVNSACIISFYVDSNIIYNYIQQGINLEIPDSIYHNLCESLNILWCRGYMHPIPLYLKMLRGSECLMYDICQTTFKKRIQYVDYIGNISIINRFKMINLLYSSLTNIISPKYEIDEMKIYESYI